MMDCDEAVASYMQVHEGTDRTLVLPDKNLRRFSEATQAWFLYNANGFVAMVTSKAGPSLDSPEHATARNRLRQSSLVTSPDSPLQPLAVALQRGTHPFLPGL